MYLCTVSIFHKWSSTLKATCTYFLLAVVIDELALSTEKNQGLGNLSLQCLEMSTTSTCSHPIESTPWLRLDNVF